jgi:glycosyltransferase involved in cell wall biosynthesis
LLRAVPLLLQQTPVQIVITGDGDMRPQWEALARLLGIRHCVQFLGFVSNEQLDQEYSRCDVWVNPSVVDDRGDTEGLGVGSIEAYLHRKPVVASAVGGIPDTVVHGKTGWLVPEKDEAQLAKAILHLIHNPHVATAFGEAGLQFAQEQFDWERITDRLEAEYYRVLGLHDEANVPVLFPQELHATNAPLSGSYA